MRFLTLELENFRQFYGSSPEVHFSRGQTHNVTVIHGDNGSGKTAILNAFSWASFGSFSPGFRYPNQLVNKRAIREAAVGSQVTAGVKLTFEHDNKIHVVERVVHRKKTSPDEDKPAGDELRLTVCGEDGEWRLEKNPEAVIGRILPADLHTYFFFDGERIERIVDPGKKEQAEISRAAKKLLGLEVLERGERHLAKVTRTFENELKSFGDPETRKLIDAKQDKEQQQSELERELADIGLNREALEEQLSEVGNRLRELEEVRDLQQRRESLSTELRRRKDSVGQVRSRLKEKISAKGYTVFLSDIAEGFTSFSEELRKKGELPAGIKRQFVSDLLECYKCICDTELKTGSTERKAVEAWLTRAGLVDVEEKIIRMGGAVEEIVKDIPDLFSELDMLQRQKGKDRQEISRIEVELDDISDKLKSSPREEIQQLELRSEKFNDSIRDGDIRTGELKTQLKTLSEQISKLDSAILQHESFEQRHTLAKRRITASKEAADRIREIRKRMEAQFRLKLQERLAALFDTMSPAPYVPQISDDYSIVLLESAGGAARPVGTSTGESQILSLAFIASIIEITKEYQKSDDASLATPAGTGYPLVMDSPFGNLGGEFRRQIAEHIPKLADQVITMCSDTQWRGEVEQCLDTIAPKQYVLTYFTPKDSVEDKDITLRGRSYAWIRRSPNEFEYTEIQEVVHG